MSNTFVMVHLSQEDGAARRAGSMAADRAMKGWRGGRLPYPPSRLRKRWAGDSWRAFCAGWARCVRLHVDAVRDAATEWA
jgi:hypothetical protein